MWLTRRCDNLVARQEGVSSISTPLIQNGNSLHMGGLLIKRLYQSLLHYVSLYA